ncbi:MAG: ribokinase [Promethearchaeota archaeon]|nr:MAG: ribokinase [Candidatus Lokiarchaeota archaeon]
MVKITVLGSYNQDVTMITPKIPRPKETITGAVMHLNPGGKGNNQANAIHKLGGNVTLIAKVGKDPFGDAAISYLHSEKMDIQGIFQDEVHRTGTAVILVDEISRENMITVAPGANHHISLEELDTLRPQIEGSDVVIFQFENNIEAILHTMKIAHGAGSTIILNPAPMRNPFPQEVFKYVNILVMNEIEASMISNYEVNSRESALTAAKIITKSRNVISIVTLGEMGVIVWDGIQEYFHHSYKVQVKDTTGAGDAFIGAFAVKYASTKDIIQSIKFASAAAAINITRIGASSANPTLEEVDSFLIDNDC